MKEFIAKEYRDNYKIKEWGIHNAGIVYGCRGRNIGTDIANKNNFTPCQNTLSDIVWEEEAKKYNTFVFNNGQTHLDWIEDQPEEKIMQVVDNTLTQSILAVSRLTKFLLKKETKSRIILIGSMAYDRVLNGSSPYCAAKAGLAHFANCIAYELAPKGIEVFIIHPSNVEDSPMTDETINGLARYRNLSPSQARDYWGAECPMGEFLTKDEISDVVRFICTPASKYLSGCNIELKGGQR